MDHSAVQAIAKLQLEQAMRECMERWPEDGGRSGAFVHYLQGRFGLDEALYARFIGEAVFSQQFEGQPATEVRQQTLLAANADDDQVFKFLLYAKVGDELKTGGGAAPACTLRSVS